MLNNYFWNGSRICDGCHDFVDEVHGDVTQHPGSFVLLVVERLCGFAFFSNYDTHIHTSHHILISCIGAKSKPPRETPEVLHAKWQQNLHK